MNRRVIAFVALIAAVGAGLVGVPGCGDSPSAPTPPRTTAQGAPLSTAPPAAPPAASVSDPAPPQPVAPPVVAKTNDQPPSIPPEKPTLAGNPVAPQPASSAKAEPTNADARTGGGIRPPGAAEPAPRAPGDSPLTAKPVPLDPTKPVGRPDSDKPDFLDLSFNELASFEYDQFDAVEELNRKGEPSATATGKTDGPKPISSQIPEKIRELNGKKITVQGFMIPLEVRRNEVKSFLLVRNTMVCCFGAAASFNEWVYVQLDEGKTTKFTPDVLVSAYGVFDLGEDIQDGMVMSIYRMKASEVALKSGY
ncbi:MAG: DUF3299 domain-containing protein [Phycisphaerae bacterium]